MLTNSLGVDEYYVVLDIIFLLNSVAADEYYDVLENLTC